MELIVFSDIHGNFDALREVIAAEPPKKENQYIFCGDIMGYYYDYKKCIDSLKEIDNLKSVLGNHDWMYLDAFYDNDVTDRLARIYGASYKSKSTDARDYLLSLPLQQIIRVEGKNILLQHGTPNNLLEGRIYPDTEIEDMPELRVDIVLLGHTHYRFYKVIDNVHWINPGSLGQPRDGLGFSYCVIKMDPFSVQFRTVEINIEKLKMQIKMKDSDNQYLWNVLERKRGGK